MNPTITDATGRRDHYDSHEQLRSHLAGVLDAYNFVRRLKALSGLTPYEDVCTIWTSEPDRSTRNPMRQTSGLTI